MSFTPNENIYHTPPIKLVQHKLHVLQMLVLLAAHPRCRELTIQLGNDQQGAIVSKVDDL